MSQNPEESTKIASIRMVIQRYRKASLLIDEKDVVTVGDVPSVSASSSASSHDSDGNRSENEPASYLSGRSNTKGKDGNLCGNNHIGMLVYISFSKTATPAEVQRAAKTILNLPIQTEGAWGDGSSTKSIVQAAAAAAETKQSAKVSVMIVPQANLIAKIKKNGKSVQYRDQIEKSRGEELYDMFVKTVEELLIEEHEQITTTTNNNSSNSNSTKPKSNNNANSKGNDAVDPSIPPRELFRYRQKQQEQLDGSLLYGTFDESTGFPLTSADGEPLTKSASKRIKKLYDAHAKKHEKYLSKGGQASASAAAAVVPANDPRARTDATEEPNNNSNSNNNSNNGGGRGRGISGLLDPSFVTLVAGSFGKRQGLELFSDMGPFCHVIEL